jgi:hypothetical protein
VRAGAGVGGRPSEAALTPAGVDARTAVAAGVLATTLGVGAHESAHALAGWLSGGDVVLVSAIGVEGYWSTLRNAGWFFLATGGSMAQGLLALGGWLVFRRAAGTSHVTALTGWALFAVNAWMPTMLLVASPALGFGDWMDLLQRFASLGPIRVSATVTGLFVAGLLWKGTCETLARLVGGGASGPRTERAVRVTTSVWLGCGLVAGAAGALAPSGPGVGMAIALGWSLGSVWPILVAARRVGERPVPGPPLDVAWNGALVTLTVMVAVLFVGFLGPGVRFD